MNNRDAFLFVLGSLGVLLVAALATHEDIHGPAATSSHRSLELAKPSANPNSLPMVQLGSLAQYVHNAGGVLPLDQSGDEVFVLHTSDVELRQLIRTPGKPDVLCTRQATLDGTLLPLRASPCSITDDDFARAVARVPKRYH
jgi:hypothetical protein